MKASTFGARIIVLLTALYLHLGPFSRHVIRLIDLQLNGRFGLGNDAISKRQNSLMVGMTA
jgi:hypothetical protein